MVNLYKYLYGKKIYNKNIYFLLYKYLNSIHFFN